MKKLTFLLSAICFVIGINAQTVKPDRLDGVIYYKLSAQADAQQSQQRRARNANFLQKYRVTDIAQSFAEADDKDLQRIFRVDFANINNVDSLLAELAGDPNIEYAEPAPLFRTCAAPNDEYYSQNLLWHINKINAPAAWDIAEGSPNIKVAIVDNAIWTQHPDLQHKIVAQHDVADGDDNANPPAQTSNWAHGTHCAGLAAAETNNTLGVASVGNRVSLIAVKTARDNSANPRELPAACEGILWAADNGADIISMSFSTTNNSQTFQKVINYAYNKGCLLVAAAGNDGNDTPNFPAAYNRVIAVGACENTDVKWSNSNYGAWIDVMSPGVELFSTVNYQNGTYGNYGKMSGTSMACPVAAGLCGLMLSANPDLTAKMLKEILKNTCDNIDNNNNAAYIGKIGAGRINALAAVQAAINSNALYADFYADSSNIMKGNQITFHDISSGTPTTWSWEFPSGSPASSNEQNPAITYNTAGVFSVKLTVGNGSASDSETKTAYIAVFPENPSAWILQHLNIPVINSYVNYTDIVDENTVWVLSNVPHYFSHSADGGNIWMSGIVDIPENYIPAGISAVNSTMAWIVTNGKEPADNGVFKTTDGGETWIKQNSATFGNAASFANIIHFFNENEGVVQGDPVNGKFEIYTTNDGGAHWNLINNANNPDINSGEWGYTNVIAAYGNNVWFGTNKGRVFHSADKGHTWQAYDCGTTDINSISFSDALNGIALNDIKDESPDWAFLRTSDGGQTWENINSVGYGYFSDVSAVPNTPGMLVGVHISAIPENNFSAYSLDYGATWTELDRTVQYTNVKMLSETAGYAGGFCNGEINGGGIYKWQPLQSVPTNDIAPNLTPRIKIYPNPADNIIYIESSEKTRYEILDVMGRCLMQGVSDHSTPLNIEHLAKGCYFIKTYNNGVSANKVIKR